MMNCYTISDLHVGMKAGFKKQITREMENSFRELSGDENPLHQDDEFAQEISNGRFPGHVSFGMLTASLYSTFAGMYIPGKYSLIHSFEELSFLNPVFAGDELSVEGEIVDKNEELGLIRLKLTIRNQNSKLVSRAKMKVLVLQ